MELRNLGYWYWRNLKNAWTVDEAATNRFDLPERGAVSGLKITVQQKNASNLCNGYDNPYPVHRIALRILGNGNYEIVNLRGRQLEAMNWWETGEMSKKLLWTISGQTLSEELILPFGRFLGDKKYGLRLSEFGAGVQLEDTNTWSTTYVTDTNQKYTIDALMWKGGEGQVFQGGYFRKRQVANEDTSSRTQHPVKIPTENKLKQLYVFTEPDLSSYLPQTAVFPNLSTLWLSILSKEEYIWDAKGSGAIAYLMAQMYGRVARTEGMCEGSGGTAYWDTKIYERQGTSITNYNTNSAINVENASTNLERVCKVNV